MAELLAESQKRQATLGPDEDGGMLFANADLERIVAGEVDLAFRRWARPMHRVGGRQRTRYGVVEFTSVELVDPATLSEQDAVRAGTDLASLLAFLAEGGIGLPHRPAAAPG